MSELFALTGIIGFAVAVAGTLAGSFVKGATGFAMPMIMISVMATVLPADVALGLLILPTLLANLYQALGDGIRPALRSAKAFRRYLAVVLFFIAGSAQLVAVLPQAVLFLVLGVPITGFALMMLGGVRFHVPPDRRGPVELAVAGFAGFVGGISGVWGPPTVAYLTAIEAKKDDSVRVQGVIYLAGACVLTVAHLRSGVLNAQTVPMSLMLVPVMVLGMWVGTRARGHMDDRKFRRWTLVVLVVAGANLVRRGLAGF